MRQQVARNVHGINEKFAIFDTDMHVGAEDQQALGEFLHILLHAGVALQGVISCVIQEEKGCVPAAAIFKPFFPARFMTVPRSRTNSSRMPAGVWHTEEPTSTID